MRPYFVSWLLRRADYCMSYRDGGHRAAASWLLARAAVRRHTMVASLARHSAAILLRRPLSVAVYRAPPAHHRCCALLSTSGSPAAGAGADAHGGRREAASTTSATSTEAGRLRSETDVVAGRLSELVAAAERIASLSDKGLLTHEEAGRLSEELADCLKLHRQYMAAIEAHAAVAVADCTRAFESDQQLAHVLRNLRTAPASVSLLPSQAAPAVPAAASAQPLPAALDPQCFSDSMAGPELELAPPSLELQGHEDLLRSIEEQMQSDAGAVEPAGRPAAGGGGTAVGLDDDLPPWPWDPLPGDDDSGNFAKHDDR